MDRNAGVYIWVDFRPYFIPKGDRMNSDYTALKATSGESELYLQREAKIIEVCASNGVMIAPGSSYRTEEYGWFRVTFTTREAPLEEGLQRIWKSLRQIQDLW